MKIVGFGDFLIHFSPMDHQRFVQADCMRMSFTGAEANVCAALALWGENVHFVTKLPDHALSQKGLMFLRSLGVKTEHIPTARGRMGIYFLESGYSLRPSSVIYDRQNTLFTDCRYEDYDWDAIFDKASAFLLSGITPALSDSLTDCCEKALQEAHKRGIRVFYDVNLRPSLCTAEQSKAIFSRLCPYITHLIGNEEHLKQLLELTPAPSEDPARLKGFTEAVRKKTGIANVAVTVRRTPCANKAVVYASYGTEKEFAFSKEYALDVVDRVGSGDAFSAGLVYSVLHGFSAEDTASFAILSSAMKHTISNDINFATLSELKQLMKSQSRDVNR